MQLCVEVKRRNMIHLSLEEDVNIPYLLDPRSAWRELPLRDGWFTHSDLRSQGKHCD